MYLQNKIVFIILTGKWPLGVPFEEGLLKIVTLREALKFIVHFFAAL